MKREHSGVRVQVAKCEVREEGRGGQRSDETGSVRCKSR